MTRVVSENLHLCRPATQHARPTSDDRGLSADEVRGLKRRGEFIREIRGSDHPMVSSGYNPRKPRSLRFVAAFPPEHLRQEVDVQVFLPHRNQKNPTVHA
jgi:hypothetical protein